MKTKLLLVPIICLFMGCSNDDHEIDTIPPEIDISQSDAFPVQCSEMTRGQRFTFKALFRDNMALGSFSLDIHHNFDQHTHSTEVEECGFDEVKTPVNPLLLIQAHDIPEGLKEYVATVEIAVPEDVDPGDYHFMIKLTDREGWQTMKGLSIKIL